MVHHVHVGNGSVPAVVQDLARETGGEAFVATDSQGAGAGLRSDLPAPARSIRAGGHRSHGLLPPFAVLGLVGLGGHLVGLCWGRYTPW